MSAPPSPISGLSELNLSGPESPSTLKTVQVGKQVGKQAGTSPSSMGGGGGALTTTPLSSTATGNTSVNKIDITHDKTAPVGGAPPDRTVPIEDLNMLVDQTKTRSEPLSTAPPVASTTSPINIQRTASPSLFETVPSLPTISPPTPPSSSSFAPPSPSIPGSGVTSLLNETTDLSDLLNKKDTADPSFAFKPSINVSTNAAPPLPPAPAPAPVSKPAAATTTTTTPAPAPESKGFFSSLFGGGDDAPAPAPATTAPAPAPTTFTPPPRPQTESEIQKEKQDLLFKLNRLQNRGMPISRKYTMSSPLDDIRSEFLSLKAQRDIQNSVKFQRKMMMAVVTGVEFLNTKFDPFDIKLDGWSESVHENVDDYDEIFEELHEKYKEKAKMAPETKLFFSLAGSAFMFHLTQSLFKTSPGMGDVLQQNPELMKQFAQAAVGAQQRQMGGGPPMPSGMPASPPMGTQPTPHNAHSAMGRGGMGGGGIGGGLGGLFSGLMGGGGGGGGGGLGDVVGGLMGMGGGESGSDAGSSYGASEVKRHQMSGPKGVDDILSQLSVPGGAGAGGGAGAPVSRLANVTRADETDIAQLGNTMRKMDTASSGYRKRVSDGMRLNL